MLIVKVEALQTLYGATDFSLHVLKKFQEEIMITDIDVTSAFGTIKRTTLIEFLESFL